MAEQSYPFDAGSGFTMSEDQWRAMARPFAKTGLVGSIMTDDSAARVTAGVGNQIIRAAAPRGAMVDGVFWRDDASKALEVTLNTDPNPRIDRAVLRLGPGNNQITTVIVEGVPGSSTPPALTHTDAGIFECPLYRYTMPGSGSAQNPTAFVDERRWTISSYVGTRGYGTGAPVNRNTTRTEPSPLTIPAFSGELVRVNYSTNVRVDGTSWQSINWGLSFTGLQPVREIPGNHFRLEIGNRSALAWRGDLTFSWTFLVTSSLPTLGLSVHAGAGENRLVIQSTYYDIEVL